MNKLSDPSLILALQSTFSELTSLHCRSYTKGKAKCCALDVNQMNVDLSIAREHHLKGRDQPRAGSSEIEQVGLNSKYFLEIVKQ